MYLYTGVLTKIVTTGDNSIHYFRKKYFLGTFYFMEDNGNLEQETNQPYVFTQFISKFIRIKIL